MIYIFKSSNPIGLMHMGLMKILLAHFEAYLRILMTIYMGMMLSVNSFYCPEYKFIPAIVINLHTYVCLVLFMYVYTHTQVNNAHKLPSEWSFAAFFFLMLLNTVPKILI